MLAALLIAPGTASVPTSQSGILQQPPSWAERIEQRQAAATGGGAAGAAGVAALAALERDGAKGLADHRRTAASFAAVGTPVGAPDAKPKIGVFTLAMPDAVPHVQEFYKNISVQSYGQIVPGVLAKTLDLDQLQKTGRVRKEYVITGEGKHAVTRELATTFAHDKAIAAFLASPFEHAVIFEDDMTLVKDADRLMANIPGGQNGNFMGAVQGLINQAPAGWHELNLGRCLAECHKQTYEGQVSDKAFYYKSRYQYCSTGYVLSRAGAEFLSHNLYAKDIGSSNDFMKTSAYERGEYKQYSVSPRIIEADARCGVNGCASQPECGPLGFADKPRAFDESKCAGAQNCELSAMCTSVDVASPKVPDDFVFASYPPEKLEALKAKKEELRGKHLRIRNINMFLNGCGFFTFPAVVMAQLALAQKHGLIGDKKPFVFMPEDSHYFACPGANNSDGQRASGADWSKLHAEGEFWGRWFDPISDVDWRAVPEHMVWEFSQSTIITSFYDNSTAVQAYPPDKSETADTNWLLAQRARARPIVKEYIHVRGVHQEEARKEFTAMVGGVGYQATSFGMHMRGTDKFVHPKVDPGRYAMHARRFLEKRPTAKLFLATDDAEYVKFMKGQFGDKLVMRPNTMRTQKGILYDDTVNRDEKARDVLKDALMLAYTTAVAKGFSAVSEFAVYFREQSAGDDRSGYHASVIDLEASDQTDFDSRMGVLEGQLNVKDQHVSNQVYDLLHDSLFDRHVVDNWWPTPVYPDTSPAAPTKASFRLFIVTMPKRRVHVQNFLQKSGMTHLATLIEPTTPLRVVNEHRFPNSSSKVAFDGSPLTVNEAACAQSHHDAIRAFLASDAQYGLVMEDDIGPSPTLSAINVSAASVLQKVIDARSVLAEPWDVINFGRCWDCCKVGCRTVKQSFVHEGFSLVSSPHPNCGSAYMMNKKGGTALAEGNEPLRRQADDNIGSHANMGKFNLVSATPRLFQQDDTLGSTLHEKAADLECGECGSVPCYDSKDMPRGWKGRTDPFLKANTSDPVLTEKVNSLVRRLESLQAPQTPVKGAAMVAAAHSAEMPAQMDAKRQWWAAKYWEAQTRRSGAPPFSAAVQPVAAHSVSDNSLLAATASERLALRRPPAISALFAGEDSLGVRLLRDDRTESRPVTQFAKAQPIAMAMDVSSPPPPQAAPPSTMSGSPVMGARYLPDVTSKDNKAVTKEARMLFDAQIDHLTGGSCTMGRTIKPAMIEWGFGATVTSIVKPVMHALQYGYCLATPPPMVKYNCSEWATLFQPLHFPEVGACGASCESAQRGGATSLHKLQDDSGCDQVFSFQTQYNEMGFPVSFESPVVKACNERYSDAFHGATALPEVLRAAGMNWFEATSLIQARTLRPSNTIMEKLNDAKRKMNWPPPGTPVIALHYRAGDACLEEDVTLGRRCEPFSNEMQAVHELAHKYNIRHVYLATDSDKAITETAAYTNYTFMYLPQQRGGQSDVRQRVELDKALHMGLIDGCREGIDALLDIYLLAQGDALVGKFSSNIDRVAYALMFAKGRAYAPFISLDNAWCFDFGVASRVDATGSNISKKFYC